MNDKQNNMRRRVDDVAQIHTKMLRVLQSKTLDKDEISEKMTTTIDTNGRTHSFETYREASGAISTNIRTVPAKTGGKGFLGEEKKEAAA